MCSRGRTTGLTDRELFQLQAPTLPAEGSGASMKSGCQIRVGRTTWELTDTQIPRPNLRPSESANCQGDEASELVVSMWTDIKNPRVYIQHRT